MTSEDTSFSQLRSKLLDEIGNKINISEQFEVLDEKKSVPGTTAFITFLEDLSSGTKLQGNQNNELLSSRMELLLHVLLKNESFGEYYRSRIFQLRGSEAIKMLNALQYWLDYHKTHSLRRQVLYLLVELCLQSGEFPSSIFVHADITDQATWKTGGFAEVWRGTYKDKKIVQKRLSTYKNRSVANIQLFYREALVWRQLRHENIVECIGIQVLPESSGSMIGILSALIDRGTLNDYIGTKEPKYNPLIEGEKLLLDIANGLKYLHSQGITHSDINGNNILVNNDGKALLCDFGIAVVGSVTSGRLKTNSTEAHTIGWTAPERIIPFRKDGEAWDPSKIYRVQPPADVFSFGLLCYLVFTCSQPYDGEECLGLYVKIHEGKRPDVPSKEQAPLFIQELMQECWIHEYWKRPTMEFVVNSFHRNGRSYPDQQNYLFQVQAKMNYDAPNESRLSFTKGDILSIYESMHSPESQSWRAISFSEGLKVPKTHFETTLFKAKAIKEHRKTVSTGQLDFEAGDILDVLRVKGGWWYAMDSSKGDGNVPANFLSFEETFATASSTRKVRSRFTYEVPPELHGVVHVKNFQRNDVFHVCFESGEWCLAKPEYPSNAPIQVIRTSYLDLENDVN